MPQPATAWNRSDGQSQPRSSHQALIPNRLSGTEASALSTAQSRLPGARAKPDKAGLQRDAGAGKHVYRDPACAEPEVHPKDGGWIRAGWKASFQKEKGKPKLERCKQKAWALENPAAKNLVYSLLWQNTAERGRSRRDLSTLGSAWESLIFIN